MAVRDRTGRCAVVVVLARLLFLLPLLTHTVVDLMVMMGGR